MTSTPSLGLDHLVILVDNLDLAAAAYAELGFTVAPEMRHPFGTANRLIMFDGNFLELVGVVDPSALSGPGPLIADRLAKAGSGPFGIALCSTDIGRDHGYLAARNLNPGAIGGGNRHVPLPDGTAGEARFSTMVIPSPAGVPFLWFLAEQHVPDVVWIPAWQRHANHAASLDAITILMPDPQQVLPFLAALYGADAVSASGAGVSVTAPRGHIDVITPAMLADRFGAQVAPHEDAPHIVAATITVDDLTQIAKAPGATKHNGRVILPSIYGATLEFVQAS